MPGFDYHLECRSCGGRSPTYPLCVRAMHADPRVSLPGWSRAQRCWLYLSIQVAEEAFPDSVRDTQRLRELAAGLSSPNCTVGVPGSRKGVGLVVEPEPACPYCGGRVVVVALGKEQGGPAEQSVAPDAGPKAGRRR